MTVCLSPNANNQPAVVIHTNRDKISWWQTSFRIKAGIHQDTMLFGMNDHAGIPDMLYSYDSDFKTGR